jgi:tetratricopeptide (TPR) repeat protein
MTHEPLPNSNWERIVGLGLACLVVIAFLFYIFRPPASGDASIPIIRFLAAMAAALSAYLFIGSLNVGGHVRGSYIRATGGFAAFLVVFFLFLYGVPSQSSQDYPGASSAATAARLFKPDVGNCRYRIESVEVAQQNLSNCNKELDTKSNHPIALLNKGRALLLLWGDPEKGDEKSETINSAIRAFEDAVTFTNRKEPQALFHYGLALSLRQSVTNNIREDDLDTVEAAYTDALNDYKSVKINELDYIPMVETGHFLTKRCRYDDAKEIYDRVIASDPNHYGAWASKGIALFFKENTRVSEEPDYDPDYSGAKEAFEQARKVAPSPSSRAQYNLGSVAAREDDFEKASKLYTEAIGLSSDFFYQAWRDRGFVLMIQEFDREAIESFSGAIDRLVKEGSQASRYAPLWLGRGIAYFRLGQKDKAKADFDQARQLGVSKEYSSVLKYTKLDSQPPSEDELKQLFQSSFGNVSDHENFLEDDPVLEVHHEDLYPGKLCKRTPTTGTV